MVIVPTDVDVDLLSHPRRRCLAGSLALGSIPEDDLFLHTTTSLAARIRRSAVVVSFALANDDFSFHVGGVSGAHGFVAAASRCRPPFFFPFLFPDHQRASMAFAVVLSQKVRLTAGTLGATVRQHGGSRSPGLADLQLGLVVAGANIVALFVVGIASRHGW
jgi:hypothetical protein